MVNPAGRAIPPAQVCHDIVTALRLWPGRVWMAEDDMRVKQGGVAMAALLAVGAAMPAVAQVAAPSVERAPGNVELPEVEATDPLVLQLAYTGDILSSVSGGRRRGTRWINNVSAIATADLDALAGVPRTTALLHAFYNDGT